MSVFLRSLILACACATAVSCVLAQSTTPTSSTATTAAAAEKELMQADRDFYADWQKNGADAWARWWAENGVKEGVKETGAGPAIGPEAVRKSIAEGFASPGSSLTWSPDEARAMEDGRMGLTRGHFVATFNADGKKTEVRGQYITIWRKQKDGNWRIVWDGGEALH